MLMAGCANLVAIQEFGKLSADSAGYTKLTEEYGSSPSRRKQYTLSSESDQRTTLDEQAAQRLPQVQRLILYHKTVSEYMKAVANLAADEVVSIDEDISGLADAAVKAKYIEEEKAKAVKSIASTIASALTDVYRQRKLREVIDKANAPLQLVLGDMATLVNAYEESLRIEKADAQRYFRALESTARHQDKQIAIAEQIWARGAERDIQLKDRGDAAAQYGKVLQKIGEAHQKLYDNREKVSDAEVQRQLRQYSKQINAAYKVARDESASTK
jgi:hypothetical protein